MLIVLSLNFLVHYHFQRHYILVEAVHFTLLYFMYREVCLSAQSSVNSESERNTFIEHNIESLNKQGSNAMDYLQNADYHQNES